MLLLLGSHHFALLLLDICVGSWMLRDWLAGLLQPYFVLCLSSYFAMSLSQSFGCFACRWLCSCLACRWQCSSACCWLCSSACCWPCSSACCWPRSSRFFSSFLPLSTLSAALRAHRRFDVLHAVLVPVLLPSLLFTTGSSAVVLSQILTTCSLAVVPSVLLFQHWLFGCGFVSDPLQRHFVVIYSFQNASPAPPTPLLSIAPFVIARGRCSGSLVV